MSNKRKRDAAGNNATDSKPKHSKSWHKKRRLEAKKSSSSRQTPTKAAPVASHPEASPLSNQTSTAPLANSTTMTGVPEGLTGNQRKRWRSREKKKLGRAANSGKLSNSPQQASHGEKSNPSKPKAMDSDAWRSITSTTLLTRTVKRWNESPVIEESSVIQARPSTTTPKRNASSGLAKHTKEPRTGDILRSPPSPQLSRTSSSPLSRILDDLRSRQSPAKSSGKIFKSTSAQKANTVPTHSSNKNVRYSFGRLSAFLGGDSAETTSNEDGSSSDSDNESSASKNESEKQVETMEEVQVAVAVHPNSNVNGASRRASTVPTYSSRKNAKDSLGRLNAFLSGDSAETSSNEEASDNESVDEGNASKDESKKQLETPNEATVALPVQPTSDEQTDIRESKAEPTDEETESESEDEVTITPPKSTPKFFDPPFAEEANAAPRRPSKENAEQYFGRFSTFLAGNSDEENSSSDESSSESDSKEGLVVAKKTPEDSPDTSADVQMEEDESEDLPEEQDLPEAEDSASEPIEEDSIDDALLKELDVSDAEDGGSQVVEEDSVDDVLPEDQELPDAEPSADRLIEEDSVEDVLPEVQEVLESEIPALDGTVESTPAGNVEKRKVIALADIRLPRLSDIPTLDLDDSEALILSPKNTDLGYSQDSSNHGRRQEQYASGDFVILEDVELTSLKPVEKLATVTPSYASGDFVILEDAELPSQKSVEKLANETPSAQSPSTYQANIGLKRTIAELSQQPYTTVSKHRKQLSINTEFLSDASYHIEPENIYDAIDAIAKDVFESTRALPDIRPFVPYPEYRPEPATESPNKFYTPTTHEVQRVAIVDVPRENTGPRKDLWSLPFPPLQNLSKDLGDVSLDDKDTENVEPRTEDDDITPTAHMKMEVDKSHDGPTVISGPVKSFEEHLQSPSPPGSDVFYTPLAVSASDLPFERESTVIPAQESPTAQKKRKMTGLTSKHFSPEKKRSPQKSNATKIEQAATLAEMSDSEDDMPLIQRIKLLKTKAPKPKPKATGKKSNHFLPLHLLDRVDLPVPHKGRVPAGTSIAPVPPITASKFGIIQEKLWDQPFWLLIAVTFLNKTTGRAAVPAFWALKEKWPTPESLAKADQAELCAMITHLGLQNARSKRVLKMSAAWVKNPPKTSQRYRTFHYPSKDDGRAFSKRDAIEGDEELCTGALEIGHIYGCGPYAWDSWRIFCRDVLRGVAEDYNGRGAETEDFEPEWKRVLPLDKELRATLRWMWLREGWIWDCESGERSRASEGEMEAAVRGEMEIVDPQERRFAALAVGGEVQMVDADAGAEVVAEEEVVKVEEKVDDGEESELTEYETVDEEPEPELTEYESYESQSDSEASVSSSEYEAADSQAESEYESGAETPKPHYQDDAGYDSEEIIVASAKK